MNLRSDLNKGANNQKTFEIALYGNVQAVQNLEIISKFKQNEIKMIAV